MIEKFNLSDLRERFFYCPESGVFTYLVKPTKSRAANPGDVAGSKIGNGYLEIGVFGRRYLAHRLAWFYVHGSWPNDEIDHLNHNRSDNRIANLRVVSRSQNEQNKVAANKSNVLGVLGVSKNKSGFIARIACNKEHKNLGTFRTIEEASNAYWYAKTKLHIAVIRSQRVGNQTAGEIEGAGFRAGQGVKA